MRDDCHELLIDCVQNRDNLEWFQVRRSGWAVQVIVDEVSDSNKAGDECARECFHTESVQDSPDGGEAVRDGDSRRR